MITNINIRDCAKQVFTYQGYDVPFYPRLASTSEMKKKHHDLEVGGVLFLSMPFGSGKTFFIQNLIAEGELTGLSSYSMLPSARSLAENSSILLEQQSDTIILDECDSRTDWTVLLDAMKILAKHLKENNKKAIILGDYTLRNKEIAESTFLETTYLESFEPLTREFLEGVLKQRLEYYMPGRPAQDYDIKNYFEDRLLDLIAPTWMVSGNSFRRVFSFLQELCREQPYNDEKCFFSFENTQKHVANTVDYYFDSKMQEEFFNIFKRFIFSKYPDGKGIQDGFTSDELFQLSDSLGIDDVEVFTEEILEPFTRQDILISLGNPYYDSRFHRFPQPYVPSTELLLQL